MQEFFSSSQVQTVIWLAVLAVLVAVGWYVASRFRDPGEYRPPSANDLLTDFRELHDEGGIDKPEYGKIKSVLGDKINDELKDAEETG